MSEKQWLTEKQMEALAECLKEVVSDNYTLQLSTGVDEGENMGGSIINADVTDRTKTDQPVTNFILKCSPPSGILRSMVPIRNMYNIEIYLYSTVFSEFTRIQKEKNILNPFKPYPHFYKSLNDDGEEMLVLENVKQLGYKHQNRQQPLDYVYVSLIVKQYAKLHALSYAIRDQKPELFECFEKNMRNHFFADFNFGGLAVNIGHRTLNALKALDPVKDVLVYDQFSYFAENPTQVVQNLIQSTSRNKVISHIDCGILNLLFKHEDASITPSDAILLDWQHARMESPAVDLVTFVFSAGDKSTIENFGDLVLEYYRCLCSFLKELGSDPEKILPYAVLQQELKTYGILGLFMANVLIYSYETQTLPDVLHDESHKEGFSYLYELKDRKDHDRRVRDAICHFNKLGYNFH
ncbi:hypothetical protein RI129_005045 [Pyrocoelia pectoralis]|uniref:CHK kinase-like domain-containing protein n=1 Tax=Pyrocoelia pectoralis TaxID=417401 RepID=A0AAN7ZRV2_9COLE